jgi:hypothetical protein
MTQNSFRAERSYMYVIHRGPARFAGTSHTSPRALSVVVPACGYVQYKLRLKKYGTD